MTVNNNDIEIDKEDNLNVNTASVNNDVLDQPTIEVDLQKLYFIVQYCHSIQHWDYL